MEWIDRKNFLCQKKKKKNIQLLDPYTYTRCDYNNITKNDFSFVRIPLLWERKKQSFDNFWYACTQSNLLIFFSSLVLFISYKIIWHFHRQTIWVSENWNGFVDRKSPFFGWREDAQCEVTYTNLGWERSEGKPIIRVRTKSNLRLRESSEITSTTLKNHYY